MQRKKGISTRTLYKIFIYVALLALAISIIVPVGWVFLASIKENSEFYGNPWTMPKGIYFQNFLDAFEKAKMGEYFMNSILVTALALIILFSCSASCGICACTLPFFREQIY